MIPWLQVRSRQALLLLAAGLLLAVGSLAVAQTEVLEITWWTVAGGGETFSSGGNYSLGGTAGQAAAGQPASGGPYTSQGGFWAIPAQTALTPPAPNIVYLPVVVVP
jgi:hypothetical protein